jgi:hypothetical protein
MEIPLPFNTVQLREVAAFSNEGKYSPFHSCQTVLLGHTFKFGFFSFYILLVIFFFSLSVLIPGAILEWLTRHVKISWMGVDITENLRKIANGAAFAAGGFDDSTGSEELVTETTPVNTVLASPAAVVNRLKSWVQSGVEKIEWNTQQLEEQDLEVLTEQEKFFLTQPAWEWKPEARKIILKVREAEVKRRAEKERDLFQSTCIELKGLGVPETEIPATPEELIIAQSEATAEFTSMKEVVAQICTLYHMATTGEDPLTEEEAADIAIKTMVNTTLSTEVKFKPLPLPVNHPQSGNRSWWAVFVDLLHDALQCLNQTPWVKHFTRWLDERAHKIHKYLSDLFDFTVGLAKLLLAVSEAHWNLLWRAINVLYDNSFDLEQANRIKSVWALSGMVKSERLSMKARLERNIAFSEYRPRGDFFKDYKRWCDDLKEAAGSIGLPDSVSSEIGSPASRRPRFNQPVMSRQLGDLLQLQESVWDPKSKSWSNGDYVVDEVLNERTNEYMKEVGRVAGDMVYIDETDHIRRSLQRYSGGLEPTNTPLNRALEAEMVDAVFNKYRDAHADMELSSFAQVRNYMKTQVSPGAGLLAHWQKRQTAFDAGWDDAFIALATKKLLDGEYPQMYHHAFVKAQVVDLTKVIENGKNLRTVVAEDMLSYFMNMVIELERNKRFVPDAWMGMGMVLNQNMAGIFEELRKHKGVLMYSDATEFDSKTPPAMWRMLGLLAEKGLSSHPSGNGFNMSSVLKAKYNALQDSIIISATEKPDITAISVSVPDEEIRKSLVDKYPGKFIEFKTIQTLFPSELAKLGEELRGGRIQREVPKSVESLYKEKIVLTESPFDTYVERPAADKSGKSRLRNLINAPHFVNVISGPEDKTIRPATVTTLQRRDVEAFLVNTGSELAHAVQMHFKDQGGGTGENATSWDNCWGFKMSYWMGWWRYYDYGINEENKEGFGITAAEVMKRHPVANTGDDNIGSNEIKRKDLDLIKLRQCMLDVGLNLELFAVDNIEDMEYLGKIYTPTGKFTEGRSQRQKDAVALDLPTLEAWQRAKYDDELHRRGEASLAKIPKWLVVQRVGDLLLRRMENRWYQGSFKGATTVMPSYSKRFTDPLSIRNRADKILLRGKQYLHVNVARSVGHALLTSFQPQLYDRFAEEWKQDVIALSKHYGYKNGELTITRRIDRYGLPRYEVVNTHSKRGQEGSKAWQFSQFLRTNKISPYLAVVSAHMTTKQPKTVEQHRHFLQKLEKHAHPIDYIMRGALDFAHEWIGEIPREIYKMQPNMLALYPDETFYTKNDYIGKFIQRAHADSLSSLSQYQSLVNQSPYGGCTDASAGWQAWNEPEYRAKVMRRPVHVYANMAILITIVYMLMYPLEQFLNTVPYIGPLYRLLMFAMIDIPKIYAILNIIYWCVKAESSKDISAVMPRDIYIQSKRFSTFVVDFVPEWVGEILPFYHALLFLPEVVELIAKMLRTGGGTKAGDAGQGARFDNPWGRLIGKAGGSFELAATQKITTTGSEVDREEPHDKPLRPVVITSETGTGKSVLLPFALLDRGVDVWGRKTGRVWLLFPRRILRDQWKPPSGINTVRKYPHQILKRGVTGSEASAILLCTYGHFLVRLQRGEVSSDDLILCDEFHELSGEMMTVVDQLYNTLTRLFFLSATPVDLPGIQTVVWDSGLQPRFDRTLYLNDDTPINNFFWAQAQFPSLFEKNEVAIRVSTEKEVDDVIEALSYRNVPTWRVSAATSHLPIPQDGRVLVCTQIIDAGINMPGVRVLIDSGKRLSNNKGEMEYTWSDKNTAKQVLGRVGRFQNGDIVVRPPKAGTGSIPLQYSSPGSFASSLYSKLTGVPQLVPTKVRENFRVISNLDFVQVRVDEHLVVELLIRLIIAGVESFALPTIWMKLFERKPVDEHLDSIVDWLERHRVEFRPLQFAKARLLARVAIVTTRSHRLGGNTCMDPVDAHLANETGADCDYWLLTGLKAVNKQWKDEGTAKIKTRWVQEKDEDVKNENPLLQAGRLLDEQNEVVVSTLSQLIKKAGKNTPIQKKLELTLSQYQTRRAKVKRKFGADETLEGIVIAEKDGKNFIELTGSQCRHCDVLTEHWHAGVIVDYYESRTGLKLHMVKFVPSDIEGKGGILEDEDDDEVPFINQTQKIKQNSSDTGPPSSSSSDDTNSDLAFEDTDSDSSSEQSEQHLEKGKSKQKYVQPSCETRNTPLRTGNLSRFQPRYFWHVQGSSSGLSERQRYLNHDFSHPDGTRSETGDVDKLPIVEEEFEDSTGSEDYQDNEPTNDSGTEDFVPKYARRNLFEDLNDEEQERLVIAFLNWGKRDSDSESEDSDGKDDGKSVAIQEELHKAPTPSVGSNDCNLDKDTEIPNRSLLDRASDGFYLDGVFVLWDNRQQGWLVEGFHNPPALT